LEQYQIIPHQNMDRNHVQDDKNVRCLATSKTGSSLSDQGASIP